MIRIAKNRLLDAFLKFVLLSALVHTALLAVYALVFWDFGVFNYFSILDLGLFIPGITTGQVSVIVSASIMATLFLVIFLFYTKSEKKKVHAKRPVIAANVKRIASSAAKSARTPELE